MRFYKIDSQGPLFLNRGAATPAHAPADEGRIFYDSVSNGGETFFADAGAWIRMYSNNNLAQLIIDVDASGAWIRKDQDDTTAFKVTMGGMIGDVYATNGTSVILNSGATGLDARLKADVTAEDTNTIIQSGTSRTTSWASLASIKATNGSDVLVTNTTVANSTFLGIATRAYYA